VLLIWTGFGLAASVFPQFVVLWFGLGLAVALLLIGDAIGLFLVKPPTTERDIPERFAVGIEATSKLTIRNPNRSAIFVQMFDGLPPEAESRDLPWSGKVPSRGFTTVEYRIRFGERGAHQVDPCHLLVTSPLGIWQRGFRSGETDRLRIYPNYAPVVGLALAGMENRDAQMGIVHKNRAGLSREFHQLREYHEGDTLSQIDWKASSKQAQLISRDYREQRDQTVILLVDRGRRMRAIDGELSQFDHCLNSMLVLSYIALRQGDKVGILGFGGGEEPGRERWLPPVKGQHSMSVILDHLYDYQTSTASTDFSAAVRSLMIHQQRRALVVLLTNLRGEDASDLIPAAELLRLRHLVVLASLRESGVDALDQQPVDDLQSALRLGAASCYREERDQILQKLTASRILTIDEPAQNLPVALANRYLEIKARGEL